MSSSDLPQLTAALSSISGAVLPGHARPSLNRRIWSIAFPAIMANLTTVLPGLCDTAFVGRSGDAFEQAGVALGTAFTALALWAFGFLRMGTTGITAQANGARDIREMREALVWSLVLALGIGLALILAAIPLAAFVLPLYGGPPQVQDYAAQYFHLRLLAAPFDLTLYAMMGWLIGVQRARVMFALQFILNALNIALCWLFVVHFNYDVMGVAAATAVAQAVTAIAGFVWTRGIARKLGPASTRGTTFAFEMLGRLARINRDIFIRTLALMLVFNYFIHLSARLEEVTLAANQILIGFLGLIANGLDGFAQSAETLVGEAVGAKDRRRLSATLWANLGWSLGLAALLSLLLWVAGAFLLPHFSANAEVVAEAQRVFPWVIVAPIVSVWCFLLDGVFIGATRGRELRDGMLISALAGLAALQCAFWFDGNAGLWAALTLFFGIRALPLALWYRRIPAALAS
ncbi:MATE family efflux transporter [Dongia sedimenti]|uniref:MATE family efflux transporter n=1 Tax=Dongia sedimenti TaxID=3064282 RepID=A0ABU0YF36_9PROT|nr:MATE family efflux transporter [Rhodospirillaceae bacterium R-7]